MVWAQMQVAEEALGCGEYCKWRGNERWKVIIEVKHYHGKPKKPLIHFVINQLRHLKLEEG